MSFSSYIGSRANTRLPNLLRVLPILLCFGDILGLFACLRLSLELRLGQQLNWFDPIVYAFFLMLIAGLYLADAYRPDTQIAGLRVSVRIVIASGAIALLTSALIYLSGTDKDNPLWWRSVLLPSLGLFTIWAIILRLLAVKWLHSEAQQTRWLILGADAGAIKWIQNLLALNPLGKLVVLAELGENTTYSIDGNLNDLPKWSREPWSGVVVASDIHFSESQIQNLMEIRLRGIPVYRLPDFYESLWSKLPSSLLQDRWLAFSAGFNLMPGNFSMKLKRVADLILAAMLLVVLSPVMLVVALAIKLDSPGPIFYSQLRSGLYGKAFRVYKFRSMYQDAEKRGAQWASQRDPRITRVGYWLRLMRIDELPQIWNVLCGEMSLIGPRPERPEFDVKLKEVIPYYEVRYLVKPGITGWAQVMYPYGASIEDAYEKLAYDLYYIKNYSPWLDLAIAFKTIRVVLLGKGR